MGTRTLVVIGAALIAAGGALAANGQSSPKTAATSMVVYKSAT
jgi:hypothetical protein